MTTHTPAWQESRPSPCGTHHERAAAPLYDARFDAVLAFHAPGLAPVRRDGNAWHIRADGSPAYSRRFRQAFGFYEGLASVEGADGWHYIQPDGSDLSDARYAWCGNFQRGRATVRGPDGRYHHVTSDGHPAYGERWRYAGDFRDDAAVVQGDDGRSTHIDRDGRLVHAAWFLDLDVFHKGFARARDASGWTHVDRTGRAAYTRRFAAVEPFYNGQARVETHDGGLEVVNEHGDTTQVLRSRLGASPWRADGDEVLLGDRYRLRPEHPIARSSHGAIWKAHDACDSRDVIVKSSSCHAGHLREVEALRVLSEHGATPKLRDVLVDGVTRYLVMDVAPGEPWGGRARCRALGADGALSVIGPVAVAVDALHAAGRLHTDIHPGNVLVPTEDDTPSPTLLDYEFAVPLGPARTWRGEVHWGRWEFVPPEQFEGFRELDPSTDTYALAGLFCFYAAGHTPFPVDVAPLRRRGWDHVRRASMDMRGTPDLTGVPERFHPTLERALHVDPQRRFPSAQALIDALACRRGG